MLAIQHLVPGTRLKLVDGAFAAVHENPHDGTWLIIRRLVADDTPSAAEELIHVDDIAEIAPG